MSNDPARMTKDEEDWEEGDDEGRLRPSAPSFVPKPQTKQDDDDWFGSRPVSNRQLWDTASTAPIIAPSPQHGSIPVNQIKILRRDPSAGQKKSPGPTVPGQKSIEERAEEYRLARERIFGKEPTPSANLPKSGKNSPKGEFAFIPTQVKKSPATSRNVSREGAPSGRDPRGTATPPSRATEGKGILRQPKGPSDEAGFGR